jgi:hypothetical protein
MLHISPVFNQTPRHEDVTAALDGNSQLHAPAALPQAKEIPVPTVQEAGWAPELVWTR